MSLVPGHIAVAQSRYCWEPLSSARECSSLLWDNNEMAIHLGLPFRSVTQRLPDSFAVLCLGLVIFISPACAHEAVLLQTHSSTAAESSAGNTLELQGKALCGADKNPPMFRLQARSLYHHTRLSILRHTQSSLVLFCSPFWT